MRTAVQEDDAQETQVDPAAEELVRRHGQALEMVDARLGEWGDRSRSTVDAQKATDFLLDLRSILASN